MSYRLLFAVLVFLLDAWALSRVLETSMPRRARLKWILLIVGVPVAGVILWVVRPPREANEPSLPPG